VYLFSGALFDKENSKLSGSIQLKPNFETKLFVFPSQHDSTMKVNTEMLKLEKESVSLFFLALTSNYFDEPNQVEI
jgi:hypothetical protein